jgi:hypothetical protein
MQENAKKELTIWIKNHLSNLEDDLIYNLEFFEDDWNINHILAYLADRYSINLKYPEVQKAKKQIQKSGTHFSFRK